MPTFAITGCAGYIAPRHLKAIQAVGGQLVAALDPHDSVGILDQFGYDVQYFKEFERFERFLDKHPVNYVSICSPNYLHEAHCRAALRSGAHAICEKPLVINPDNLDLLSEAEAQSGKKVYPIMQMRYHPEIQRLKAAIEAEPGKNHIVNMTYITSRGPWYQYSWKGDPEKSGGLLMNIGVHLFDLLLWIFGEPVVTYPNQLNKLSASGNIEFLRATASWYLSIDPMNKYIPVHRSLIVNTETYDFTSNAGDLHTLSYQEILAGRGWGIEDARPAIELVNEMRQL